MSLEAGRQKRSTPAITTTSTNKTTTTEGERERQTESESEREREREQKSLTKGLSSDVSVQAGRQ